MPKKASSGVPSPMEQLLGPNLMTAVDKPLQSTKSLLEDKELVLLYFSASWCPPCKAFSPLLKQFYTAALSKSEKIEIIYVSSDTTVESFEEYYGTMPWLAIPTDATEVKRSLAQQLKVAGIPTLVVLDVKTGFYITDNGRYDVAQVVGMASKLNESKMIDTIQAWKAITPVPLDQAESSVRRRPPGVMGVLSFLFKNPIFIFGLYFVIKQGMKHFASVKENNVGVVGGVNQNNPVVPAVKVDGADGDGGGSGSKSPSVVIEDEFESEF